MMFPTTHMGLNRMNIKSWTMLFAFSLLSLGTSETLSQNQLVDAEIQVLSTNLANNGTRGEWGFAALVKTRVEGQDVEHCVLWDTGRYPETVLQNAISLGVDLSCVQDIVLSHFHFDHTGGLFRILDHLAADPETNPIKVTVAEGIFQPRHLNTDVQAAAPLYAMLGTARWNLLERDRKQLESGGAVFIEIDRATEIVPGVWATGPVTRTFNEENYPKFSVFKQDSGSSTVDTVPESQGLVIKAPEGPIVLSGCGHAGTVNLVNHVTRTIQSGPLLALMGGLHLYNASEDTLRWTGKKLSEVGVKNLMAGHCTGIMPMFNLQEALGLGRSNAVIGAVGATFDLEQGINATPIAK